ncbi:hypothetical protein AB0B77_33575 [Microbispora bryophytorum]
MTDGLFAETQDLIADWMIIDVESWDRAVQLAGRVRPSLPPASAVALMLPRHASRASRNGPGCRPAPLAELPREGAWRV